MNDFAGDTFTLTDSENSMVFRPGGSFGLTCRFDNVVSADIKVFLGNSPDLMPEDESMAKTLTSSVEEGWQIESYMKYAKVEVTSSDPFRVRFDFSRAK
jgi:hypothetical protein